MLAAILVPRTRQTAVTTMECLKMLQSPDVPTHIPNLALNNLSDALKPVLSFSLALGFVYTSMQDLSDDTALNYEGLRVELLKPGPKT